MKTALSVALHEGHGFRQDQGWHQTAHLMTVAAQEIERLSERVRELEDESPDRTRAALARSSMPLGRDSA